MATLNSRVLVNATLCGFAEPLPSLPWAGGLRNCEGLAVYWDSLTVEPNPFDASYLERLRNRDSETEAHFVNYFEKRLSAKLRAAGLYNGNMLDARQETICRSLRKIYEDKVQSPERLGPFVFGICDNVILEFYRGEKDSWDHDGEIPDVPDPREDAENVARHREHLEMVARVLSQLSEKEQKILTAVFLHERDKDEICSEFRITREYLRVLLHRALGSARKLMENGDARRK